MANIQLYQASQNRELSTALLGLEEALERAAAANVAQAGDGFTDLEKRSMLLVEKLHLINGMDLAAVLLRGKMIKEIRAESAWANHPSGYSTLEEMAAAQGISISELSNTIDLTESIFPYIENQLGLPVAQLWEQIGKSNFRDLVPILKAIIGGTENSRESVAASVNNLYNDIAATAASAGRAMSNDEIRREAIGQLLEAGQLPNRELRQRIRPDRTSSIQASLIRYRGRTVLLAEIDEDQRTLVSRRLHGYMDLQEFHDPNDVPLLQQITRR